MPCHLVIAESPAKAKTLGNYLGRDFVVRASRGPVRDLPKGRLAVDPARGFAAEYEVPKARRRVLDELRAAAREAETITLAADPDREGEAICWHLAELLGAPRRRFQRVSFHELTRAAVEQAFQNPGTIDARRVEAEQARRILDRLVGHSLGPLLSPQLQGGPPPGRVPSVALRIVCDRERAILAFVPEERWAIRARLDAGSAPVFSATLVQADGSDVDVHGAEQAQQLANALRGSRFRVSFLVERQRRRPPPPPFTTATLQQEAFRKLRFPVKRTMQVAQRLYEGVELGGQAALGLITFTRTDSTQVAPAAAAAALAQVASTFGPDYVPAAPHVFRASRAAQEAIRPCDPARTPESLRGQLRRDELALYTLVFERFLASQMASAVYAETRVEIEAQPSGSPPPPAHRLRASGSQLLFRGFLAAHEESPAEDAASHGRGAEPGAGEASGPLPPLTSGQELTLVAVESQQRFSEPPPRFSEASFVEELASSGLGRPSTYAAILATLVRCEYVRQARGRLEPTPLGIAVSDLLLRRFPDLLSVGYTAAMEDGLDAIAEGRATLLGTLGEFWGRFAAALEAARCASGGVDGPPAAARPGPPAGAAASLRRQPGADGVTCPRCQEGRVVERRAQDRTFFGCSGYPACRFTATHRPLAESCPECGAACLFERETKREGRLVFCGDAACHFQRRG
ncbi:MAG: type I DNA topoisomerase [Betaproteobacteria bacterium]